jgi:hypothetical protein
MEFFFNAKFVTSFKSLGIWEHYLSFPMILVFVLLAIAPVLRFLWFSRARKRDEILGYFDAGAVHRYLKQFRPADATSEQEEHRAFVKVYDTNFGRTGFLFPILLLTMTLFCVAVLVTSFALDAVGLAKAAPLNVPEVVVAALTGAYMWVVLDFILRMHRRHFSQTDVYHGVLRLVIAVPLAYAFTSLAPSDPPTRHFFIAFALGAFPLGWLLSVLRKLLYKRIGLEDTGEAATDQILKLQGINGDIADRFKQEDIHTITQLATEDPIRLAIRANLSFNFVLDCISQALAWMYLGARLDEIRPFGLRGAHEIKSVIDEFEDPDHQTIASAILERTAVALQIDKHLLLNTFEQIGQDPYTVFIHGMYR